MIVNEKNAYILEVTSRLGYPIEPVLDTMNYYPTGQRLLLLATGKLHKARVHFFAHQYGMGIVCGTYGFPYAVAYDEYGENQPFAFDPNDKQHIYLDDVYQTKNHYMTATDGEGWICTATASDDTMSGTRERAFDVVDRLSLPGLMYRKDIGEKVQEHIDQLKKWGWL
jgi:phosphoribosylamine-glycine ligase